MAKALSVPSVEPFRMDGDSSSLATRWERWMKSFQYFVTGSGVTDKTQKRALLLHLVGPEVQGIFETLEDRGADNDYDQAVKCLEGYFKPKTNVSYERHKFNSAKQKDGESIQEFSTRLKQLALSCEFTDRDDRIRDQLVEKCVSSTLRRKFLCEKNLTLDKALELSSIYERAQDSASKIENNTNRSGQPPTEESALRVKEKRKRNHERRPPPTNVECWSCGRRGHKSKDPVCPAKDAACSKCLHTGHFARKCRNPHKNRQKPQKVRNVDSGDNSDNDYSFNLSGDKLENTRVTVEIGTVPISMIIDSGSTCNIVDKNTWEYLKSQKNFRCLSHEKTDRKVFAYGTNEPLKLKGTFRANIKSNTVELHDVEFTVLDGKGQSLLGKDTAIQLDVLRLGAQVRSLETDIERQYPSIFDGIGKLKDFTLNQI